MELQGIEIKKDFLRDITKNIKYNHDVILDYYCRLHSEDETLNLSNKLDSIYNCNSFFLLDVFKEQKIKDFKKTNLCKDKFCNNCKKVKQASRMGKFIPQIEKLKDHHNLYLLTLTVPNCNGTNLKSTIDKIFKSFYSLNRYLKLEKKIRGLDFSRYGYSGALRSLEVTFKGDSYHPHIHAVIALDKDYNNWNEMESSGNFNTNSYSYNNYFQDGSYHRELTRIFSDFEILIQKIWYLLFNSERVTLNAINSLDQGYSCTLDSIDDSSYYEVFKYMTKATDEKNNILTYENFKTLYFSLYRVRQIQGYGTFYNFKDDDSMIDEVDDIYNTYRQIWEAKEKPEEVSETPQALMVDNVYTIVSRKRINSYLKNL